MARDLAGPPEEDVTEVLARLRGTSEVEVRLARSQWAELMLQPSV